MNKRRLQGGSLVGYVAIAVLLGLVLVGGLYGLQRYNAAQDEKQPIAQEESTDDKAKQPAKPQPTSDDNEAPAAPATDQSSQDSSDATKGKGTANTSEELPTTGPTESAITLVAAASLTFAVTAYLRSRSHHWTKKGN